MITLINTETNETIPSEVAAEMCIGDEGTVYSWNFETESLQVEANIKVER